ncbi:hypothetical protein L6R52_05025 [Myxococcota bacterium]|nr:hypothetical protein [Myxococcota bacterium]
MELIGTASMKHSFGRALSALTLAALAASPMAARADDDFDPSAGAGNTMSRPHPSSFVFSAIGPGAGNGTIAMGGRVYLILPTYDLHYIRGLTDRLDFVFDLSTLGVISEAGLSLRFRLLGEQDSGFALGVKAGVTPLFAFIAAADNAAGGVAFAATPGLVASFGSRTTQFSLGLDAPIYFGAAAFATGDDSGSGSTSGTTVTLRPAATIEFPVSATTNMYVQASGIVFTESEASGFFGPILAVGAAW